MITLRDVSKSFGSQPIVDEVSLQINQEDRYALVGPNGAGKSTLFKIIMGAEPPDEGEVILRTGMSFGYLPQETFEFAGKTVLEEAMGDSLDSQAEPKAKKILMGLGFKITDFGRHIKELSGGWQMRAAIARLLVEEPDLLLLDEPTNHLDLETLLWFQNYLQNYRGAIFLISHDRAFINSVISRIVEIRNHKLKTYTGTYEEYLAQKKQEEEQLIQDYTRQQKEIKELEDFIMRFRAKASTASRAQAKIKYLEKMERIVLPDELKTVGFSFPQPARSGQVVLSLKDASQSYDGKRFVYKDLNIALERGHRVALVGPNGAGKSTLLKLFAGVIPLSSGERKEGYNVEVGYFSQHRAEMFEMGRTVLETAAHTRRSHSVQTVRTVLGSFLFREDTVFKKVEVLSGGEKSRLGLARLLLDPPNFLLLDEPTTHLDMASVDVLIEALKRFEGTIAMISHDVYFIRQLATNIVHVKNGQVTWYPGDYDYFLHKKSLEEGEEAELFRSEERIEAAHARPNSPAPVQRQSAEAAEAPKSSGPKTKEQKRKEAEERNARYRAQQEQQSQQDVRTQLSQQEATILEELGKSETYLDRAKTADLTRRLGEIRKQMK